MTGNIGRFKSGFVIWLLLSGVFSYLSFLQPLGIFGDGLEYIVQTQAFVFDQSISINTHARADYWNETNPFGLTLISPKNAAKVDSNFLPTERSQAGGGFGSLYPSRSGEYYYVHSWIYSLACVPVYTILHSFSGSLEYRSFELLNSMLLAAAIAVSINSLFGLTIALLLVLSPLGGYISWSTPEVFQFALVAIAFSGVVRKWKIIPTLLVGIASAQNLPITAFLLPLVLFQLAEGGQTKGNKQIFADLVRLSPLYVFTIIIGIFPWLLYQINFGTPNLIVSLGQASIQNCSLTRFLSFLFSPLVGVFWFFPVYFFLLPIFRFPTDEMERFDNLARSALLILTTFLCFTMTGMANFHSQQLGCARYAVWIFAPIAGLLLSTSLPKSNLKKLISLVGIVLSLLAIYFYNNPLFLIAQHPRTNYLGSFPKQARILYRTFNFNEDPEVLVETLLQREIISPWEFDSRYEIPLGNSQALCLVSLRSMKNGKNAFSPKNEFCRSIIIPDMQSGRWRRSPVLGGYFLEKATGS